MASQARMRRDPSQRLRVLIVDDNVDAAETLAEMLRMANYEVVTAYHGPAGLARFYTFSPHVAILDLGLPGLDGFQLARMVRTDDKLRDVLLIAFSAYDTPKHRARTSRCGFAYHLCKPDGWTELEPLLASYAAEITRDRSR